MYWVKEYTNNFIELVFSQTICKRETIEEAQSVANRLNDKTPIYYGRRIKEYIVEKCKE